MKQTKISIIGAGAVGTTIAYALMLKNIPARISLIDIDEIRCRGEILDLSDTLSVHGQAKILNGNPPSAGESDIIIIAAGQRQKPGQDRRALLSSNKEMLQSIIKKIKPINPEAIMIVVSNPVDAMSYFAQQFSNLPAAQVFGSGTFLDTQRLREQLSIKLNISERSIHAYVIGEHGDSQVPLFSSANIAGAPLSSFNISGQEFDRFAQATKDKAYEIIACKGATYYGIGSCVAALCRTIIFDEKMVTPVSCFIEQYQLYMSMPIVLGRQGIEQYIKIPLNPHEQSLLDQSAKKLKEMI